MVDLVNYLKSLLFFYIRLLNFFINLRSSIVFIPSFGDVYLSLDISSSFITISELFFGEGLKLL